MLSELIKKACELWDISEIEFRGRRRNNLQKAFSARCAVSKVATEHGYSLIEIGRFCSRDHTTIMYQLSRTIEGQDFQDKLSALRAYSADLNKPLDKSRSINIYEQSDILARYISFKLKQIYAVNPNGFHWLIEQAYFKDQEDLMQGKK